MRFVPLILVALLFVGCGSSQSGPSLSQVEKWQQKKTAARSVTCIEGKADRQYVCQVSNDAVGESYKSVIQASEDGTRLVEVSNDIRNAGGYKLGEDPFG